MIVSARPIDYTYDRQRAIILRGGEVDADTLRAINAEGYELIARVTGYEPLTLVVWHSPLNAMGDEGQHYLVKTEG